MAAFCINTHSQEFKDAAKRLGVSQFELEQIAYKYGNQEGTFGQFPSDNYIKEQLDGTPDYDATEAQAELWKMRYSTPREFDTLEELNAAKKDALQYFGDKSVHSFVNADGKYELRVAEQDNEYQRIKEQAIADGTFMKAPNGNQSNLNEQQWLQVRTRAFKRWFGDWEKSAKRNAIDNILVPASEEEMLRFFDEKNAEYYQLLDEYRKSGYSKFYENKVRSFDEWFPKSYRKKIVLSEESSSSNGAQLSLKDGVLWLENSDKTSIFGRIALKLLDYKNLSGDTLTLTNFDSLFPRRRETRGAGEVAGANFNFQSNSDIQNWLPIVEYRLFNKLAEVVPNFKLEGKIDNYSVAGKEFKDIIKASLDSLGIFFTPSEKNFSDISNEAIRILLTNYYGIDSSKFTVKFGREEVGRFNNVLNALMEHYYEHKNEYASFEQYLSSSDNLFDMDVSMHFRPIFTIEGKTKDLADTLLNSNATEGNPYFQFGDENVSKVVDENGEPLVVYHGTDFYGFDTFSKSDDGISYFFSSRKSVAESYINDYSVPLLGSPLFSQIRGDVEFDFLGDQTGEVLTVERLKQELKKRFDSGQISEVTYNRALEDANKLKDGTVEYYTRSIYDTQQDLQEKEISKVREKYKDTKTEDLPNYSADLAAFLWDREDFIRDLAEKVSFTPELRVGINPEDYRVSKPSNVYGVFLNIRNPKIIDAHGANWDSIPIFSPDGNVSRKNTRAIHRSSIEVSNADGTVIKDVKDWGGFEPDTDDFVPQYAGDHYTSEAYWQSRSTLYIASSSNQIKSATENRGTFYENDPGIYNQKSPDTGNVTGLPDQMTANEAFQILSKQYAPDSSEAKLSKFVFDALQKTGITFRAANLPMGVRGRFSASDNAILFSKDGILNNTLLHEAIHAVSVYYMKAANREGFSDEIKIAIKEIEECYDLLKEYLLDKETKNGGNRDAIFGYLTSGFGGYYGLSSATELVAEITNPNIAALIKEFDATHKGQNIFKRLIDAIAKFFGINKTYGSLEKTLKDALVTLIENPNADLMQRYALENKTLKDNYHALDSAEKAIVFGARKQANEAFEDAEFNEAGEYETTLVVPLDSVTSGYVYGKVTGAHHELTQSPVGAIFKMYSGEGFGTFLLNGSVIVSEKDNTVSIPVKAINKEWLQTHTFDIATSQNGVAYMTNVKPLFGQQPSQQSQPQQSPFVQTAEFYSGAAQGSDIAWAMEARKLGIRVKEYTRQNWNELTQEWKDRLSAEYESVARDLARPVIPVGGRGDIEVRRDMMQADKADAIFAIGVPVKPGETGAKYVNRSNHEVVDGGTGYAVQRGIQRGIPVYLYDRIAKQWKMWDSNSQSFVATEEPTLTPHAAVIGTRGEFYADRKQYDITDEEKGVIRSVLQKTIGQPQQQSQQTLDIWAGQNPTNADLSNFAYRPFTIPMGFQLPNGTFVSIPWQARSVEAAFQALKLNYTNKGTLEEEAENNEIQKAILSGRWQSEREDGAAVKRLGNKIKNLNQPAWNRDRQAIMKELIKMSFQQNPQALQRLLATGDAILTHNRESSESIWRTEFPRILMEVRSELRAEQSVTTTPETSSQEEPMWAPPKVERAFREGQETIVTKMDNLLKSGTLSVAEVMDEANKAMDWISDQITQYLEDPELVWSKYKSSEDKNDVVARVSKMSRKELVDYIGVPNIINIYAAEVLSPTEDTVNADGSVTKGNKELFKALGRQGRANYRLIRDNIDGLIQYGYTRFLAREGFGFQLSDVEGEGFTTTEEISPEDRINVDNFNATDNIDGDEETRNQQEHWMIENATRDIMDNASVKVKQAIADCYLLEDNGKVKEDGTPDYDIAKDKLNRNERIVPIQAVRSIVKWIQGATKLSQMIERLEAQVPANPWVSQLVTRLKDTSGEESDFQSQFFNTFEKHFQAYSVVKMNPDGSYYTMTVNVNPALADALENMAVTRKVGGWSLVNENGLVNLSALEDFKGYGDTLEGLGPLDEDTREGAIDMVGRILFTLGLPQTPEVVDRLLTESFKNDIILNVKNIADKLAEVSKNNVKDYNPFEYGGKYGIRGFVTTIIKPFTNLLEETMVSSVFDSGKMYQSYLTPSWTTKLFQKMHLPDREFKEFILDEFGSSEWFIEPNTNLLADLDEKSLEGLTEQERDAAILQAKIDYISDPKHSNIWRTPWLAALMRMTPQQREEAFQHKVQLNFNKQNYMRGMDDLTYVMSVFTEYFSVSAKGAGGNMFAYYRFPMLSNKPSNEFVKFVRYANIGTPEVRGADANAILRGYVSIFRQELSRIQTVEMRNLKEGDEGYIANFDANNGKGSGLRFNFLDYLNEYLTEEKKTTALGQLLNRKLHATQSTALPDGTSKFYASPATTEYAGNTLFALTAEENSQLEELVKEEIAKHLDGLANRLIEKYKANGLFEALKSIEGVGKTDFDVEGAIREFAWNDNFAQANLLQILITDKAFYKNEEDLQKRLAQVHSPGTRGNWEALDFGERDEKGNVIRPPQRVSDGKLRVLKLKDYKEVKESIIENLKAVFDKKVEAAPTDQKQAMMDLRDNIIGAFEEINVVDGQAFVSPTAYRKKAFAFGEWTKDDERIYKNLLDGRFNMPDIKRVFNPRKPFTYGKTTKQVSASLGTPIKSLRYGVQYKDSEYLLIMADALLKGQETGRPNLLGAIFDVMENSYRTNPTEGLDFAVFDSGVKTGLSGAISISEFIDAEDGQRLATEKIQSFIYQGGKLGGAYDENYIDVLDAEDYTTQQSVPEHFMHGSLQWGSQIRALMPSDLETSYDGQPVVYEYTDPATGETIQKSAEEIRKDWEENTKKMVDLSVEELRKELGLVDGMSIADSNVLISKILQREILSNPRYGVDLLLACSVDAEGNFRIPLGDPIQSKRVEQLLNSIIKNRINKQKVAGGTLVEVTNFGTSKRLNIRFKDKNDTTGKKLLDTRAEYLAKGHTQKEFEDYVKENQGGIAYYECYAPAWTRDLFLKFADEKGNIDIEAIEMLEPDLLKMYGYRIPTEDKYSTAPYKIVGFLPQEAGDGFMQPWETTVIDGSDFDVDKKNLMRMDLNLKSSIMSKKEYFEQEGIAKETEEAKNKYEQYKKEALKSISVGEVLKKLGDLREFSVSELEKTDIDWYEKSLYRRDREALKEERAARNEQAEDTFDRRYKEQGLDKLDAAINELESREDLTAADEEKLEEYKKDYDKKYDKLTKSLDTVRASNERWYKEAVEERRKRLGDTLRKAVIKRMLQYGIFKNSSQIPENERALFKAVKQAYIDLAFKVERPKAGTRGYYNNLMFNMQWAIATHASTADKMLNPGNFDPQKRAGYMVEANRLGYDWNELQKMSIGELKDLVFTSKNLMDFDVQTQFYKQNSVAGQVLGIFAVAKSAHAMFESRNYGILIERPFHIDGMEFSGAMHYDQKYDRKGNLIGKTLGSLVGASADAVKDPVLNLMNINKETINVLNTALRLGLDFETAALLLSSKAVSDVIETYRKNSLTMKTSFDREVKAVLRELEKKEYIGKDSTLQMQDLTREEMVWSIRGLEAEKPTEEEIKKADMIKYKVLNAILGLSNASKTAQPLSDLSRLNSITSAPGPLYINTIVSDRKFGPAMSMDGIVKFSTGENGVENYVPATRSMVFDELKSLGAFYQSYDIAKQLFKRLNFTTASDRFEQLLGIIHPEMQFSIYSNEALLKSLADFFQSFLLVQSGVIKSSALKRYTTEFVTDYMVGKYTKDERVANNPLIKAIQPKLISKKGQPDRYALNIDTTGMEQPEKDALSAGWTQLEKDNPELSHMLFAYNFFRGGIGFSPKTFMGLVPIQVKEGIAGYNETFEHLPEIGDYYSVFDQWVRNNWTNTELVTKITTKPCDENTKTITFKGYREMSLVYNSPYIRVSTKNGDFLFVRTNSSKTEATFAKIDPLGGNREYLEIYPTDTPVTAVDNLQRGLATFETQESEIVERKEDNPDVEQTPEEQTRELTDFYQVAFAEEAPIEETREVTDSQFEEVNKDLDIQTNKDKFDDIMDNFC